MRVREINFAVGETRTLTPQGSESPLGEGLTESLGGGTAPPNAAVGTAFFS